MRMNSEPHRAEPLASRRGFLLKASGSCALCLGWGMASAVHAQSIATPYRIPTRFSRPSLESDEGGLWALMDREETKARRSPFTVRDEKFRSYLASMIGKLAGEHSRDVRLHIFRTPGFNAAMAPNGMMQLWSGLLLRMENEAQLAAVIGHELGHYFEKHSLAILRQAKSSSALASILAPLGIGGLVGAMAVMGGFSGFSRDQERSADAIGQQLMSNAGFDPRQASLIWSNLIEELKAGTRKDALAANPLTASHPAPLERVESLVKMAENSSIAYLGDHAWFEQIAPFRMSWLQDEIQRANHEESLVLFDRLLKLSRPQPEIWFAKAEVFRLRNQVNDGPQALKCFEQALALESPPYETYRGMGLLQRSMGQKDAAAKALAKYLELAPSAPDAGLMRGLLEELKT
jgi:beta-barrel assembly-enhancing protease